MQSSWLISQGAGFLGDAYRVGRSAIRYLKGMDFSKQALKDAAGRVASSAKNVGVGAARVGRAAAGEGVFLADEWGHRAAHFARTNTRTRNISIALGAGAIGYATSNKDASTGQRLGRGLAFATMGTYEARIATYNRSSFRIAGQALGDRAYGEAFAALKQGLEMPTMWGFKHSVAVGAFYGLLSTQTSVMQGAAFGGIAHLAIKGDFGSVGSRPLRYQPKRVGEPLRLTAGSGPIGAKSADEIFGTARIHTMHGPEGPGQFAFTPSKPVFDPFLNNTVSIASEVGKPLGSKAARIATNTYSQFNIRNGARVGMLYGAYKHLGDDDATGLSVVGGGMKGAAVGAGLVGGAKFVKAHPFATIATAATILPVYADTKEAARTIREAGAPGFDTLNADGDLALALHKMRHS